MNLKLTSPAIRRMSALVLLTAAFATQVQAMSLRELRTLEKLNKEGENYALYYLVGVMEGAFELHSQAVRKGAKPEICLTGRRLEPGVARGLFDAELQRNAGLYEADMPVQFVLTNALVAAFPCAGPPLNK